MNTARKGRELQRLACAYCEAKGRACTPEENRAGFAEVRKILAGALGEKEQRGLYV